MNELDPVDIENVRVFYQRITEKKIQLLEVDGILKKSGILRIFVQQIQDFMVYKGR